MLKLVNAFLKQHRKELGLKGYTKMTYLEKLEYLKSKTKGTKYERDIAKFTKPRVDKGIKKVLDKSGRGKNVRVKSVKKPKSNKFEKLEQANPSQKVVPKKITIKKTPKKTTNNMEFKGYKVENNEKEKMPKGFKRITAKELDEFLENNEFKTGNQKSKFDEFYKILKFGIGNFKGGYKSGLKVVNEEKSIRAKIDGSKITFLYPFLIERNQSELNEGLVDYVKMNEKSTFNLKPKT
tara:strand:+ start:4180 stop:4890 length:711 start_codon:yes stop_codon:yes gene_type:complete